MVDLIGIVHGVHAETFMGSKEIRVNPSKELLNMLRDIPKRRVGVERLLPEEENEVRQEYYSIGEELGLNLGLNSFHEYWTGIIECCHEAGHEVVHIEDKEMWRKYLKSSVEAIKIKEENFFHEGESDLEYHRRLCTRNVRLRDSIINLRYIHEIERDELMLQTIRDLDIAIVGRGHSDFWIAEREKLEKQFGIQLGNYSTEEPDAKDVTQYTRELDAIFYSKGVSNTRIVYDREGLQRSANLMLTGNIVQDRTPSYVGVWDVSDPSEGYFEMFVENEENGNIQGTIEDCLGSGVFTGSVDGNSFNFEKQYTNHGTQAIQVPINYKGKVHGDEIIGYHYNEGFGRAFYMVKTDKANPIDMGVRWMELKESEKELTGKDMPEAINEFPDDIPF